jgi:hypothetical protein
MSEMARTSKRGITAKNSLEWAEQYPEVKNWLNKVQKKAANALRLHDFCEWAKLSPTQLLALKTDKNSMEAERLLDTFVASNAFTNSQTFNMSITVKSFFKHNYRDLADEAGKVDLQKVRPYNILTKESLRKLWQFGLNPRDRALIPFVCSTAIAKETLSQLTWGMLEPDWEKQEIPCIQIDSQYIKGHGVGRYKGVKQVTFLTPEAKRELLIYRDWIEKQIGRKLTAQDHIWLNIIADFRPINYMGLQNFIRRITKATGVKFSLHDGRRWVNTALESIAISPNWARKIRGRKVRGEEAPYSQPAIEQLRAKYKEAVPLLEFTTESRAIPQEIKDRQAALEAELAKIKNEWYRERAKKRPQADCEDGKHCGEQFEQVKESELLNKLKNGWEIVKELSNGEVIVKRA